MLLSLDDPLWSTLEGGYRVPYDASLPLMAIRAGEDVWQELWEELHHQGDVGAASYAAIPQLVDICTEPAQRGDDFYALIALVEIERHRRDNPPLPEWLEDSYRAAWAQLPQIAARDLQGNLSASMQNAIFAVMALARGNIKLGAMLIHMDSSEVNDWLEERLGWSELYQPGL